MFLFAGDDVSGYGGMWGDLHGGMAPEIVQ
jgi:hypothetical protein